MSLIYNNDIAYSYICLVSASLAYTGYASDKKKMTKNNLDKE